MIERVGTCPYCGQNNMVRVDENASNEEVNRAAVLVCKCEDAKAEQKRESDINVIEAYIKNTLKASERVKHLLMAAVGDVGRGTIKKIDITAGNSKYTIAPTSKGLKCSKVTTNTEERES